MTDLQTLPGLGRVVRAVVVLCACMMVYAGPAWAAQVPSVGDVLPAFALLAPDSEEDRTYLGVDGDGFTLADMPCELILLEVVGVYCPFCHKQAPSFNGLAKRLARGKLGQKVRMLAVATGATEQEAAFLRENSSYSFPVVRDQEFAVHKALGGPGTPFTMLVRPDGKVEYTHTGILLDIDGLFQRIKELTGE